MHTYANKRSLQPRTHRACAAARRKLANAQNWKVIPSSLEDTAGFEAVTSTSAVPISEAERVGGAAV
jgi:hypothetical protein